MATRDASVALRTVARVAAGRTAARARAGRALAALVLLLLALWPARPAGAGRPSADDNDPPLPVVTETRLVPLPPASQMLRPFSPGEELTYAVKFGPLRAGTAVLTVMGYEWANGGLCYRLRSTVRTSGFFSNFFKVDDMTESWFDVDSLFSRRYFRNINEGGYHRLESVQVDARHGLAYYFPRGDTARVDSYAQDVLSVIYFARGLPIDVGQSVMIPGHVDRKNVPFELRVLKRETVKVPAGNFACGVVEPLLRSAGLFKQEGRVTLWVSDDAHRYPVIVRSRVKVGAITAVLESIRPGNGAPPDRTFGTVTPGGGAPDSGAGPR